jgi:hypothetical protein
MIRALFTIALFVGAAVAGGYYWVYSTQQQAGPPESRFRALANIPEPPVGIELRTALERRDSSALGILLNQEHQQQLGAALRPVVAISEVRLLGAVQTGDETAIGYLVRGQDSQGDETVAGLVLNLKDNLLESLQ